jgi:ligand-binding sensor domain-containing protein
MKSFRNLIILAIFLIIVSSLFSQNTNWMNYFGSLDVTCFANQGNILWIGTDNGLLKFNKSTHEKYLYTRTNSGLRYNAISSLAIDHEGALWVGTYHYFSALNIPRSLHKFTGNIWTEITLPDYNPDPAINRLYGVSCMAFDDSNTLWIGMDKVFHNINGSWIWIQGTYNCKSLDFDSNNKLWIGEESYYIPDEVYSGHLKVYDLSSQVLININDKPIMKLVVDDDDRVWFSSKNSINLYFNSTLTEFNSTNSQIPDEFVNDICLDETGVLWFVTWHWLGKFNGNTLNLIPSPNDPQDYTSLSHIFVDLNASIWMGNYNYYEHSRELVHWNNGEYEIITTNITGLTNDNIKDINIDVFGNVWVAAYNFHVVKYDGISWTIHHGEVPSTDIDEIYSMDSDSQGNIWIASNKGIVKYNGEEWVYYNRYNSPLLTNDISSLVIDNEDNIWAGTYYGLYKFDGFNWTLYNVESGAPGNNINDVKLDNYQNIWVSTYYNGIGRFDGNTWIVYNSFNTPMTENSIYSLVIDSNNVVYSISTSNKLYIFNGIDWNTINLSTHGINSGRALFCDNTNKLWISNYQDGSGLGVWTFNGVDFNYFDMANSGLPNNDITSGVSSNNGDIWIGTSDGIAVYNEQGFVNNHDEHSNSLQKTVSNYPNPFNTSTKIRFQLTSSGIVQLNVYNIKGQLVKKLNQDLMSKGQHDILWDGRDEKGKYLASGVYIYKLSTGIRSETGKMILLK